MGQGWQVTSILNFQTGMPYYFYDSSDDISGTGEGADRWNFHGNLSDLHWSPSTPIPFFVDGTTNPACVFQCGGPRELGVLRMLPGGKCCHYSTGEWNFRQHGAQQFAGSGLP